MNNKNSKVKKIVIAAMAVICAFSSATAITAGAKTTQYKHTAVSYTHLTLPTN